MLPTAEKQRLKLPLLEKKDIAVFSTLLEYYLYQNDEQIVSPATAIFI